MKKEEEETVDASTTGMPSRRSALPLRVDFDMEVDVFAEEAEEGRRI